MDFAEIIGFLILFLSLLAPLFKRVLDKRDRKKNPEHYAEQERAHKEYMDGLHRQIVEELLEEEIPEELEIDYPPKPEPTPVLPRELGDLGSEIENRHLESDMIQREDDAAYAFYVQRQSRIKHLISKPGAKRDMVLLNEILNPPLSLR